MKPLIGQSMYDLDTPALVLDVDVLQRNIARMQEAADRAGLRMRPHIKAHKTPEIAHLQMRDGAAGVTAAKLSEAEVFATAGVEDIFIANEIVGERKVARLLALARRVPRLSVAVDCLDVAQPLSQAFARAGLTLDVVVEIDNGAGRCGVSEEGLVPLAREVGALPGLRLAGIMAYCSQGYQVRGDAGLREVAAREGREMAAHAQRLRAAGIQVERISGGSTPTGPRYERGCGLTEIRPGTYCLNDYNQVDLGACGEADVATAVLATVISRPSQERAIVDAGAKAMGTAASPLSDGCGFMPGSPAKLVRLNDEHGYLDVRELAQKPRVGHKVLLIPPRICTCLNLHDHLWVCREGRVEDVWRIAARGKVL